MNFLKRTFSSRRSKRSHNYSNIWDSDAKKVHAGSCSFQVKYLGAMEVSLSRGMGVCEAVIKKLHEKSKMKKKRSIRAIFYISGVSLRIVDEIYSSLLIDQVIDKVSFCTPDRYHRRGFAYICREGYTRRWMCHAFMTIKEPGERISRCVGVAFSICLESKQRRLELNHEKNFKELKNQESNTSNFSRKSSYRRTAIIDLKRDPQLAIIPAKNNYLYKSAKSIKVSPMTTLENTNIPLLNGSKSTFPPFKNNVPNSHYENINQSKSIILKEKLTDEEEIFQKIDEIVIHQKQLKLNDIPADHKKPSQNTDGKNASNGSILNNADIIEISL
ncbi:PTB domain adapter protein CED-6 [Intoshia linei]|uniref:PTB domain adapter protein CED-6 n=1 Tax=Intoshia linei TaxID=1819745 RepID=A0A177AXK1_9BILA|nr:PTB domain adapter protein CED-6 [Intoshia linei]